jgi:hypothetical protein
MSQYSKKKKRFNPNDKKGELIKKDNNNLLNDICNYKGEKISFKEVLEFFKIDETKENFEISEIAHLKIVKLLKNFQRYKLDGRKIYREYISQHLKNIYINNQNDVKETIEERNNYIIFYGKRLYPNRNSYIDAIERYVEWFKEYPIVLDSIKDLHKYYYDCSDMEKQIVKITPRSEKEVNERLNDSLNNFIPIPDQ